MRKNHRKGGFLLLDIFKDEIKLNHLNKIFDHAEIILKSKK